MDTKTVTEKELAGKKAAELVKDGMVVGLGTGSTVYYTLVELGRRIEEEDLQIKGVPSSKKTEDWARNEGIETINPDSAEKIDIAIDGADEVCEKEKTLIKGGGGALTREKIIDYRAKKFAVVVDSSKVVKSLGKFPVAVEVIWFGNELALRDLEKLGCKAVLREGFETDNGNMIYDCDFKKIKDAKKLEKEINQIPGVLENGLFTRKVDYVYVGKGKKAEVMKG